MFCFTRQATFGAIGFHNHRVIELRGERLPKSGNILFAKRLSFGLFFGRERFHFGFARQFVDAIDLTLFHKSQRHFAADDRHNFFTDTQLRLFGGSTDMGRHAHFCVRKQALVFAGLLFVYVCTIAGEFAAIQRI